MTGNKLEIKMLREIEGLLDNRSKNEVVRVESRYKEKIDELRKCFSSYRTIKGAIVGVDGDRKTMRYTLDLWGRI